MIRSEHAVVRDDGDRVVCSLWGLGRPIEDQLVLDATGSVVTVPPVGAEAGPTEPLSPAWRSALGALLARESSPILRPWIAKALAQVSLLWGPVSGDLLEVAGDRVILSLRLPRLFTERLMRGSSAAERLALALAFISEVARLLAPLLRLRAQAELERLSEDVQWEAVEMAPAPDPHDSSLDTLIRALGSGSGFRSPRARDQEPRPTRTMPQK